MSADFRLLYTKQARDDIGKLDTAVQKRLDKTLLRYQSNPLISAKRLKSNILGQYRWRIGDHRVIFDIKGSDITILHVGHRRNIYDR